MKESALKWNSRRNRRSKFQQSPQPLGPEFGNPNRGSRLLTYPPPPTGNRPPQETAFCPLYLLTCRHRDLCLTLIPNDVSPSHFFLKVCPGGRKCELCSSEPDPPGKLSSHPVLADLPLPFHYPSPPNFFATQNLFQSGRSVFFSFLLNPWGPPIAGPGVERGSGRKVEKRVFFR